MTSCMSPARWGMPRGTKLIFLKNFLALLWEIFIPILPVNVDSAFFRKGKQWGWPLTEKIPM